MPFPAARENISRHSGTLKGNLMIKIKDEESKNKCFKMQFLSQKKKKRRSLHILRLSKGVLHRTEQRKKKAGKVWNPIQVEEEGKELAFQI